MTIKFLLKYDKRKDVLDFERDLMTTNGEWIM